MNGGVIVCVAVAPSLPWRRQRLAQLHLHTLKAFPILFSIFKTTYKHNRVVSTNSHAVVHNSIEYILLLLLPSSHEQAPLELSQIKAGSRQSASKRSAKPPSVVI